MVGDGGIPGCRAASLVQRGAKGPECDVKNINDTNGTTKTLKESVKYRTPCSISISGRFSRTLKA